MSVLLVEKKNIADPMQWFCDIMGFQEKWQKDPHLKGYTIMKNDSVFYYCEAKDYYRFEDYSNFYFEFWDTEAWINLAGGRELIYGYFSDDDLSAEFLHIKDGKCVREFREYFEDESSNVNVGTEPKFASWVDVASYVERM